MAGAGKGQQAPGRPVGKVEKGQDEHGAEAATQRVHGGFEKLVLTALDNDVPGGMQKRRAKNKQDN